ncbi:hypothetical protein KGF56_003169 [Candida oxycetoniae]|uniref:Uncharacterized protein n=1 Tax=Candida oxycetoniae TaxID=497107 RepID=A0AAI9SWU8_9ASCO|nr:uncharacterized protein KGF56_003169 [Candida oxycetoniae]KAI3404010.2 hypothetical protein KGF56_003169 [Candida oxycetoniae]
MFDIQLLKSFPVEVIYKILDQDFLSLRDVSNYLFNKSTHSVAQQILNERCLAHICVGKRRNYESVITSLYDNEVKRGPHYWHVYYNFTNSLQFANWLSTHNQFANFTIQIFIDQFEIEQLRVLKLLQGKNLKIYLNWEDEDSNTVSKFSHVIWPSLGEIFDLVNNRVKLVLEYENVIDLPMTFDLDNLVSFEWRYYYSTGQRIELASGLNTAHNTLEKIIINSMNRMPLDIVLNTPFPNLTDFIVKSPLSEPQGTCRLLSKCPRLKTLVLHSTYFGDIAGFLQSVAPTGLQKLKTLELCNNRLGHIEGIDFSRYFPSLQNLTIKFENGSPHHRFEFKNIVLPSTLRTLNLQAKRLISFNVIKGPSYLFKLDLSYNNPVSYKFDNTFEEISILNLSYNRSILSSIYRFDLFHIADFIFFKVEELHLQGCNINNEDLEALASKYHYTTNDSTTFPLPLCKLRKLNLSNNKLTNLRCFNNHLFRNMKSLTYLDLSFNAFYYLNDDNFPLLCENYPNLLTINLTGNSRLNSVKLNEGYPKLETMYTPVKQNY